MKIFGVNTVGNSIISGSLFVSGGYVTASLFGTASYAATASYALNAAAGGSGGSAAEFHPFLLFTS